MLCQRSEEVTNAKPVCWSTVLAFIFFFWHDLWRVAHIWTPFFILIVGRLSIQKFNGGSAGLFYSKSVLRVEQCCESGLETVLRSLLILSASVASQIST